MARFHDRLRARVEEIVAPESVEAMVTLSSVTGGSQPSYNAEQAYANDRGLDPTLRMNDRSGGFGLLCALGPAHLHFLSAEGNMRSGDIALDWTTMRDTATVHHRRAGLPGARNRLFHFTFEDGRYYLGSAPEARLARSTINDPRAMLRALGSQATEVDG
ncbi:MAG: hypothetical protein ACR2N6_08855 [Miltoncostaeaceae bacterium]